MTLKQKTFFVLIYDTYRINHSLCRRLLCLLLHWRGTSSQIQLLWKMSENKPIEINEKRPEWHIAVVCARRGVDITKTGRNDPCPCDSGKKFKKCCINEGPEELCYRFSKADYLFNCANAEGEFEEARKQAEEHNYLLKVLRLLDPGTFRDFQELKVVEV